MIDDVPPPGDGDLNSKLRHRRNTDYLTGVQPVSTHYVVVARSPAGRCSFYHAIAAEDATGSHCWDRLEDATWFDDPADAVALALKYDCEVGELRCYAGGDTDWSPV